MADLEAGQVAMLDKAIAQAPFASLLGMELVEAHQDRVSIRLPYRPELTTYSDTVHGGAIAALLDATATACFWAHPSVAPGSRGATVAFTVNFVSAARGKDLVATASVRKRGREVSTGEVSVTDADGKEVAVALVTYKLSPP